MPFARCFVSELRNLWRYYPKGNSFYLRILEWRQIVAMSRSKKENREENLNYKNKKERKVVKFLSSRESEWS